MAHRTRPPRPRHELLAGLRRRAVDADPRHHLPAHGVRGRAVLPDAGGHRQGHRADAPHRADRAAHRAAVAREDRQAEPRGADRAAARQPGERRRRARPLSGASTKASAAGPPQRRARSPSSPASSMRRSGSPPARWRRSRCSTSRSRRCAASSRRSKRRSTPPRRRTRTPRPASPISASGSTWRWRSGCRSCRATAPTSSAGCAPFSATGPTSASSATASCSSRRCSSTPARRCSSPRAAPSSTSSPPRCSSSSSRSRRRSPGCCGSTATPTCGRSAARIHVQLGALGRARHLGGAISHQPGACRRSGWSPPASANSSRSIRRTTEEAYSRNRRIELKLTER